MATSSHQYHHKSSEEPQLLFYINWLVLCTGNHWFTFDHVLMNSGWIHIWDCLISSKYKYTYYIYFEPKNIKVAIKFNITLS